MSTSSTMTCIRCSGSGEIGRKCRGTREVPGPVPDDARGWYAATCPDCKGVGVFIVEDEDDEDTNEWDAAIQRRVERYGRDGK